MLRDLPPLFCMNTNRRMCMYVGRERLYAYIELSCWEVWKENKFINWLYDAAKRKGENFLSRNNPIILALLFLLSLINNFPLLNPFNNNKKNASKWWGKVLAEVGLLRSFQHFSQHNRIEGFDERWTCSKSRTLNRILKSRQ